MSDRNGREGIHTRAREQSEALGPQQNPARVALVVLGMHRSGTSALARVLSLSGAKLPSDLMGASHGNDSGHWESTSLSEYHERMLAELGSSWNDWRPVDLARASVAQRVVFKEEIAGLVASRFGNAPLIVVKDPRICRFVPLFSEAMRLAGYEPQYVLSVRSPLEVVQSLQKRNEHPRGEALLLWLRHVLEAEHATRGSIRAIVPYEDLMAKPTETVTRVRSELSVQWPYEVSEIGEQTERFISPKLRHHQSTLEQVMVDPMLRDWGGEVYSALLVLARHATSQPALAVLDRVRTEFNASTPVLHQLLTDSEKLRLAQVRHFEGEIYEARQKAEEIARAEAPLRVRIDVLESEYREIVARAAEDKAARDAAERIVEATEGAARRELEVVQEQAKRTVDAVQEEARRALAAANQALHDAESRLVEITAELGAQERTLRSEMQARVHALESSSAELKVKLTDRDAEIAAIRAGSHAQVEGLEAQVSVLRATLGAFEARVVQYEVESRTWGARIGRLLTRMRKRFAPAASPQARLLGSALKAAESVYRFGPRATAQQMAARLRGVPDAASIVPIPGHTVSAPALLVSTPAPAGTPPPQPAPRAVAASPPDFAEWITYHEPTHARLAEQRADARVASAGPLISIVLPVYKVSADVLAATLQSLINQTYPKWEGCIAYADPDSVDNWNLLTRFAATDSRFRPMRVENKGISENSNAALRTAHGEFIGLLDHDDELTPWALYDMAKAIVTEPDVDFLYSDKDTIDETGSVRMNPLFKPEWSPEMLYSVNYLTHFNVMRRSVVEEVGAWRAQTDGAQDWDIFLRVTERSRKILRVPGVHYHWRVLPTSVASGIEAKPYAVNAQLLTIKDRVERLNLPATVMADAESGFRLHWRAPKTPQVDLVIATASYSKVARLLDQALDKRGDWLASLTIIVPHGPVDGDFSRLTGGKPLHVFENSGDLVDQSSAWLRAIEAGSADSVVCLGEDIDALSVGWLQEMAGWVLGHPEIGFAGSLLLTDSNEVLEAGRVVGASGTSAPFFSGTPLYHWGAIGGPLWFRNVSAVGTHLWSCKRALWTKAGVGEAHLPWQHALNERFSAMRAIGKRGVVTPHVRAVRRRRNADAYVYWDDTFRDDPYFHPAFASTSPLRFGGRE